MGAKFASWFYGVKHVLGMHFMARYGWAVLESPSPHSPAHYAIGPIQSRFVRLQGSWSGFLWVFLSPLTTPGVTKWTMIWGFLGLKGLQITTEFRGWKLYYDHILVIIFENGETLRLEGNFGGVCFPESVTTRQPVCVCVLSNTLRSKVGFSCQGDGLSLSLSTFVSIPGNICF